MYGELYQYLVLHKQLNIPGIGTFQVERKPANIDFIGKVVSPPAYTVALHHGHTIASKKVFSWLSDVFNISERDALSRFNDFAFELRDKIMAGDKLQWDGVGILSKGLAGEIRFDASLKGMTIGEPIPANKVIRENAQHIVRVGEDQKTSTEMMERLVPAEEKRSYRWAAALIIGLLTIVFIAWYFSTRGMSTTSTGNQQQLEPQKEAATYKLSP
jgi:hypothetical protein